MEVVQLVQDSTHLMHAIALRAGRPGREIFFEGFSSTRPPGARPEAEGNDDIAHLHGRRLVEASPSRFQFCSNPYFFNAAIMSPMVYAVDPTLPSNVVSTRTGDELPGFGVEV